jgi:hypothetical protein
VERVEGGCNGEERGRPGRGRGGAARKGKNQGAPRWFFLWDKINDASYDF